MSDRVIVGRIKSPFGLQGWVWMDSFTQDPSSLFQWTPWTLIRKADLASGRLEVVGFQTEPETWKLRDKGIVVRLKGCPDRTSVEKLVNCVIEVDSVHLPKLSNDEFYWRDLEGCRTKTLEGVDLGIVQAVIATGANDVVLVKGDENSVDRTERLIPFIEQTVTSVDMSGRVITVDWDPEF